MQQGPGRQVVAIIGIQEQIHSRGPQASSPRRPGIDPESTRSDSESLRVDSESLRVDSESRPTSPRLGARQDASAPPNTPPANRRTNRPRPRSRPRLHGSLTRSLPARASACGPVTESASPTPIARLVHVGIVHGRPFRGLGVPGGGDESERGRGPFGCGRSEPAGPRPRPAGPAPDAPPPPPPPACQRSAPPLQVRTLPITGPRLAPVLPVTGIVCHTPRLPVRAAARGLDPDQRRPKPPGAPARGRLGAAAAGLFDPRRGQASGPRP